jgi:phage gpG-like protein
LRSITFEWEPDPAVFAQRFYAVAGALEDRAIPLAAASEELQSTIRERFDTQTDPDGVPWKDWSDKYRPVAEKYPNIGILQRTGELADVASSSRATVITNDTVFYQTDSLPQYGLAHEAGIPNRGRRGGELPKRAFLGLSEAAALKIYGYFSEWFEEAIQLYVTSTGRVAPRHAIHGGGGLFVSRSSAGRGPLPKF